MNKRYTLLLLVAIATTAFGQHAHQRLRQLDKHLQKQENYAVGHFQNNGPGSISHTWRIYFTPDLWLIDGMNEEEIRLAQHKTDSVNAICQQLIPGDVDTIRDIFANLRKESSANYMYEYHNDDNDTILYSLAFCNDDGEVKSTQFGKYPNFVDFHEKAMFEYKRGKTIMEVERSSADSIKFVYGNRALAEYYHVYSEPRGVLNEEMKPFDHAAFKALIQPTLESVKQLKNAKEYPVFWQHDVEYNDSISGGLMLKDWRGSKYHAGISTGIHYFIPAQYEKEGKALYLKLDSVAHNYVNSHPEQNYNYAYYNAYPNINELHYIVHAAWHDVSVDDYYLGYYRDMTGLHIVSVTTKGVLWIPKEWTKLKSWVNGKKEYLKGMEQGGKHLSIVDAIAAKQWHIDISSMNTMRYGARTVTPDFFLELKGDSLRSYLPYLGQAQVMPTLSPSMGLNFEEPVLRYVSRQKSKYTQIDIDVKTSEDTYHYVIEISASGRATIRVRSLNRDPISFDGTLVTSD